MNIEDAEIKKLREKWPKMSYDDKIDKFLWKMVWFHHEKHIPGNPSQPINDLSETLKSTSASSEKLTKSIRIATWVAGIAAASGVVLGIFSLVQDKKATKIEIKQKVFDECFNYYATINPEIGIDKTTIQTCKEKAEEWNY